MNSIETPSRTAHPLDLAALSGWLAGRVPGWGADVQAERIDGGQSNPSWVLRGAGGAWVLRAKPAPASALLPSSHAIEREVQVLQALQGSGVPVPRVRALCEDESVLGVAFYLMDFVPGRIFRDPLLPGVPVAERAACLMDANRVLAALHDVPWQARGLTGFGRQGQYFSRQIARWLRQYRACVPEPVPVMERLAEWLAAHIPPGADAAGPTTLTHGDYRLENLMFHPTRSEVVAVLDWELSTLGHPLGDLAYNTMAWHLPAGLLRGYGGQDLAAQGIPDERTYIAAYCARRGLALDEVLAHWPFYLAFNLFRLGAILQGIARRARDGTAPSASAHEIARMAEPVAQIGWDMARRATSFQPLSEAST